MSRMHILEKGGGNVYTVVVHAPMPAGNNLAGVSWATASVNAGLQQSSMALGNGPGQISNSENNDVANGTLIEATFPWGDNPAWTPAERAADLAIRAQQAVDAVTQDRIDRLQWYGRVVA